MRRQETSMEPAKIRHRRATVARLIFLGVVSAVLLMLALLNLTPGHFGFADTDGCACLASYTTQPPQATCEATRYLHCDHLWMSRLLVYISYLDFNK